jgi:hypothetical protein
MHIATRHYDDRHPVTHEWFDLEDRLYRRSGSEFALFIAGELPGDPAVVKSLSLSEVFAWYQDCPEQIERLVIEGEPFANGSMPTRARLRGRGDPAA